MRQGCRVKEKIHRRDAGGTEMAQRRESLRDLCDLCVSAVISRSRWVRWVFMLIIGTIALVLPNAGNVAPHAAATAPQSNDQDYSKFLHTSQRHTSVACSACHHRIDNSAQPIFPSHKDCTGCHLTQFTTPNVPMCSICHTSVNGNDPPRKAFPGSFKESFNM